MIARLLAHAAVAATVVFGSASATLAADKKVIRINHAGADDIVGTEHQLYAWTLANYVNQKAPTLDVKPDAMQARTDDG